MAAKISSTIIRKIIWAITLLFLLCALILGVCSLTSDNWISSSYANAKRNIGLFKVCIYNRNGTFNNLCYRTGDAFSDVPAWLRGAQIIITSGQVCGFLLTVLSCVCLFATDIEGAKTVDRAFAAASICTGFLIFIGLSNSHVGVSHTSFPDLLLSDFSLNNQTLPDVLTQSSSHLGSAQTICLASGVLYITSGLLFSINLLIPLPSGQRKIYGTKLRSRLKINRTRTKIQLNSLSVNNYGYTADA